MAGKNPSPMPMRDTDGKDNLYNSGFRQTSAREGQQVVQAYGLDRSSEAGTAQDERDTERGFGGSPTNLSHSLSNTSANLTGRSK